MPTRKQKRRELKAQRHDYEFVYLDGEGNELDEVPEELEEPKKERTNGSKPAATKKGRPASRGHRQPRFRRGAAHSSAAGCSALSSSSCSHSVRRVISRASFRSQSSTRCSSFLSPSISIASRTAAGKPGKAAERRLRRSGSARALVAAVVALAGPRRQREQHAGSFSRRDRVTLCRVEAEELAGPGVNRVRWRSRPAPGR